MATVKRPRIAYYKENLPTPLCIFFSFFFALAFKFNGGVFLPTALQMSSELGYIKEDVSMAGYASFIGMTIIFPILFRLKFRFTTRSILLTVCPILIACNLITMHISLTIYIAVSVPFKHFFQALCVLSFIRTSIATPLAWTEGIPMNTLYNLIRTQTTLTSLKELFGWVCIQGTIFLIIIMSYRLWRDREETFRHPVHKAMNFHRKVKTRMRKRI